MKTSLDTPPTPPPPSHFSAPQIRCMACNFDGPLGKVLKCRQCHFRVHAGEFSLTVCLSCLIRYAGACGAVVEPGAVQSWRCEVCENEETLEALMVCIVHYTICLLGLIRTESQLFTMSPRCEGCHEPHAAQFVSVCV
jgi:hypothetical protein